jgi:hypothetical protein
LTRFLSRWSGNSRRAIRRWSAGGYRRFLATTGQNGFVIDRAKAEEDARFDGIFVLRIADLGRPGSWPEILPDLDSLTETEVEQDVIGSRSKGRRCASPRRDRGGGRTVDDRHQPHRNYPNQAVERSKEMTARASPRPRGSTGTSRARRYAPHGALRVARGSSY